METAKSTAVTLRPFRSTDVDDFMAWASDDRVTGNLRWETFTSKDQALTFINEVCIPHPWRRSICIEDRSVGFVSIFPGAGDGEGRFRADIGYAVATEWWGHGVATKAVKVAVGEVFRDWPHLVRLQAYVDLQNKASQRVLEKIGFTREGLLRKYFVLKGTLRDMYIYSLLNTDQISTEGQ